MVVKRSGIKSKPKVRLGRPRAKKKGKAKLKGSFIGLRIDDDLKARLELLGDHEGKSTSDVLKDLIKKHVETKEALDIDLDDDNEDNEEDHSEDNFDSNTGRPIARAGKKRKEPLGEQVTFETLLDDLLRYEGRLKELNVLLEGEKANAGWFGQVPPHLKVAKTVCEKKLKLITDQMKALFPDMPTGEGQEGEEEREERECDHIL